MVTIPLFRNGVSTAKPTTNCIHVGGNASSVADNEGLVSGVISCGLERSVKLNVSQLIKMVLDLLCVES